MSRLTFILSVIGLISYNYSFGQGGNVFLKHYTHTCKDADNYNFWIKEEKSGIMIFANSKGILSYDGVQWNLIKTQHPPLSIETNRKQGKIYAGFRNDFGYYIRNEKGNLTYTSLAVKNKSKEIGEIVRIFLTDNFVYFCNTSNIFQINIHSDKLMQEVKGDFSGYAVYKNNFIVNVNGKGLHYLNAGTLYPIPNGNLFADSELLFGVQTDAKNLLIGNSKDDLYFFNGYTINKFQTEAQAYIEEHILSDALSVNDQEIIIGTLAGGCMIIDRQNGKIKHFVNTRTGLPDNEVMALGKDRNGGIWISHNYGFSRIDQNLPFKEYTHYQGLEGNLVSVLSHQSSLYISTTEGIYYFKKLPETENIYRKSPEHNTAAPGKKNFHTLFDNIFSRKRLSKEDKKEDNPNTSRYQTWVCQKKFTGTDKYLFEKIEGIDAKCKSLVPFSKGILVTSTQGLFEIKGHHASPVLKETYINCIVPLDKKDCFYIGTRTGVLFAEYNQYSWKIRPIFKEHSNIYSIAIDASNNVWLGSNGKIFRLSMKGNDIIEEKRLFYLDRFYNENILTRNIHGVTSFFTSTEVFYYNTERDSIFKDPRWSSNSRDFTFSANQDDYTWFHSDSTWTGLHNLHEQKNLNISYLSFFNHPRDIFLDDARNIWIIDGGNRLFKFESQKLIDPKSFEIHLQSVRTDKGMVLPLKDINLDYKDNSLHFSMSAPFYFDEKSVQYQYHLEGMTQNWSSWTKDHKIELTYLPIGDYTLHIRAKNGLGQMSEVRKVEFRILPPYWKTPWFFALEIIFFFTLILVSVMMNHSNESSFWTKALTFLTLIILIEFIIYEIETVVSAGNAENPIIRFGFNVMLALMISPIEKILEAAMTNRKRNFARLLLLLRKLNYKNLGKMMTKA